MMNDTKHLWRVFLLVVIAVVAVMVGRLLFVPKSFNAYGFYRADNVMEQRELPVKHQGAESCEPCHGDEHASWMANGHKTIMCEDCHAPYATHIKNDEKSADMEVNKSSDFCLRCHQKLPARPSDFPQISPVEHLAEYTMALTDTVCLLCHNPHDPTPKDASQAGAATKTAKE